MEEDKNEEKKTKGVRCGLDFLASIFIFALSIYVFCMGIHYWHADRFDEFYYSAGLMPCIIAIALCLMSIIYFRRTVKAHGFKNCLVDLKDFALSFVKSKVVHKALGGLVLFFIYIFFMLHNLPFWLATFIALSAILIYVNFEKNLKKMLKFVLISAITTGLIILVFQVLFGVPMP